MHNRHVLRSSFVTEKNEPRTVYALLTCAPLTAVEWTSLPEKEREQPAYVAANYAPIEQTVCCRQLPSTATTCNRRRVTCGAVHMLPRERTGKTDFENAG